MHRCLHTIPTQPWVAAPFRRSHCRVACRAELPQMIDAFKSHSDYYGFPHDEHSSVLLGYNGPAMGAAFGFNRNPKNIANL